MSSQGVRHPVWVRLVSRSMQVAKDIDARLTDLILGNRTDKRQSDKSASAIGSVERSHSTVRTQVLTDCTRKSRAVEHCNDSAPWSE